MLRQWAGRQQRLPQGSGRPLSQPTHFPFPRPANGRLNTAPRTYQKDGNFLEGPFCTAFHLTPTLLRCRPPTSRKSRPCMRPHKQELENVVCSDWQQRKKKRDEIMTIYP